MNIHFVICNKVAFSAPLWHENVNAASKDGQKYTILNMKEGCVKVKLSFSDCSLKMRS